VVISANVYCISTFELLLLKFFTFEINNSIVTVTMLISDFLNVTVAIRKPF